MSSTNMGGALSDEYLLPGMVPISFLRTFPSYIRLVTEERRIEVLGQVMYVVGHVLNRFLLDLLAKEPKILCDMLYSCFKLRNRC